MEDTKSVAFSATLHQIKTEPSGGWRITLDVPESDSDKMLTLSMMRDRMLQVGVVNPEDY